MTHFAQAACPRLFADAALASVKMCCASFLHPTLPWAPHPISLGGLQRLVIVSKIYAISTK